jgi:hypothetical protein
VIDAGGTQTLALEPSGAET